MSSKHIIGIGHLQPGKVVIIHGNALECVHGRPLATLGDCADCVQVLENDYAFVTQNSERRIEHLLEFAWDAFVNGRPVPGNYIFAVTFEF